MPSSTSLVPSQSNSYPYPPPIEDGDDLAPSLSLRDFLGILRRRRTVAINTFVIVVVIGIAITLITKPTYRTNAKLMVRGATRSMSIANSNDPLSGVLAPKPGRDIDTQIEILRSARVIDRVYKAAGVTPGSVTVDVRRVQQTDFIDLTATSTSKQAAEQFATAMPKLYQQDMRDENLREVGGTLAFARASLTDEQGKLQRAERALERVNKSSNVTGDSSEVSGALQAVAQSQTDQVRVESSVESYQASVIELREQRRGLALSVENPVTTTNPQLQILRDQIATLQSERKDLLFRFKEDQDEVRKVDLQISDLRGRLANTPATITSVSRERNPAVDELDRKIGDAQAQLNASRKSLIPIRAQVARQKQRLSGFNSIQLQQAQLLRDRDISAAAAKSLTQSVSQLTLKQKALEAEGAPVDIMQPAGPATKIAPRMSRNLLVALFLGALLAAGAALLGESLDDHVRDEDEARRLLRTPILGYFAQLPAERQRPLLDLENPDRVLLENFRVLRSNVQFTLVNSPGRKLQVTSSVPGEGKSYVASNLAIAMALDGRRVILIDADLHRPTMHTVFNIERQPGLTNVLVGSSKLLDCLQEVGIPNLRVLSAGASPPNPVELLNSPAMNTVLEVLEREADVLIFDTPPLLATADSQVMSSKVDGVIYVMQLGKVPRSAIQRSFELLQQAQAHVAGMVFNRIEEQQRASYGNYAGYYDEPESAADGAPIAISNGDPDGEGVNSLLKSAKRFLPPAHTGEAAANGVESHGVESSGLESNGSTNHSVHPGENGESNDDSAATAAMAPATGNKSKSRV